MTIFGSREVTIDDRGRFVLPAPYRKLLLKDGNRIIITKGLGLCLQIYSLGEHNRFYDLLTKTTENRSILRFLLGSAVDLAVHEDGRIVIPDELKKYAGVESKAIVIGNGNKLEIWSPEEHKKYFKINSDLAFYFKGVLSMGDIDFLVQAVNNYKEKIFICHSSEDKAFVLKFAGDLKKRGIDLWLDVWEMKPGDSLFDKIEEGIESSSKFIIVLSPASVNSIWCKRELNQALSREFEARKVFVIPVLYRNCKMPGFLKEKIYVDLSDDNYENGLNSLIRYLM